MNIEYLFTTLHCKPPLCKTHKDNSSLDIPVMHGSTLTCYHASRAYPGDLQVFCFLVVYSPPLSAQKETLPHPRAPDRPHIRIFWVHLFEIDIDFRTGQIEPRINESR